MVYDQNTSHASGLCDQISDSTEWYYSPSYIALFEFWTNGVSHLISYRMILFTSTTIFLFGIELVTMCFVLPSLLCYYLIFDWNKKFLAHHTQFVLNFLTICFYSGFHCIIDVGNCFDQLLTSPCKLFQRGLPVNMVGNSISIFYSSILHCLSLTQPPGFLGYILFKHWDIGFKGFVI